MNTGIFRRFVTAVDAHPFSMAIATVGTTTMTGVAILKATSNNSFVEEHRPLTMQEAHFRAMLENAKDSTWRENLATAAMAQEQSMTHGGREDQGKVSRFMKKINAHGRQILHQDQEYWQQKKEYESQQKVFATTTIW